MKIIIDIPGDVYNKILQKSTEIQAEGYVLECAVLNGTPLEDVKIEIINLPTHMFDIYKFKSIVLHILDNISKRATLVESEDKNEREI